MTYNAFSGTLNSTQSINHAGCCYITYFSDDCRVGLLIGLVIKSRVRLCVCSSSLTCAVSATAMKTALAMQHSSPAPTAASLVFY